MTPHRLSGASASTALAGSTDPSTLAPMIVGGEDADIKDFPWHVGLIEVLGSGMPRAFCGGSILSERWILTAAHCLVGVNTLDFVRAGVTDKNDATGQDVAVLRQILHPLYGIPVGRTNDIALLELADPLDLTGPNAKAIPIMTAELAAAGLENPGVMAIATGWGATSEGGPVSDILQQVAVPIVSNEDAARFYGSGSITPAMIAAGYPQGEKDACQNDSGGPLVVPDSESPMGVRLAGVTSWGNGCARENYPGIWARVSQVEGWILQTMEPAPASIPTLGAWGLLAVTGLLGLLGASYRARGQRLGHTVAQPAATHADQQKGCAT